MTSRYRLREKLYLSNSRVIMLQLSQSTIPPPTLKQSNHWSYATFWNVVSAPVTVHLSRVERQYYCSTLNSVYGIPANRSVTAPAISAPLTSSGFWQHECMKTVYVRCSHCVWSLIHPTYVLMLSFLRCHLTVTVTLMAVIATKVRLGLRSVYSYDIWPEFHWL